MHSQIIIDMNKFVYGIMLLLIAGADDPIIRFVIEVAHSSARSSPYTNFNISNSPWDSNHYHGEITNVGFRESYLLGRSLREKYMQKAAILNEKYDDYQMMVKTAP